MHDVHEFLKTLAIVLGVAAITTVVFQRIRKPVILGYLIAGLIVGPHLPLPLNADPTTVRTLSELGVILLMFAIGLELNIAKLVRVAPTAGVIGVLQVALMMFAGVAVGRAFGWTQIESIFAGAAIAMSSTTIIAKVFEELKVAPALRELVYGVLIVEDILAILLLAVMTTVASGSGLDATTLAVTTGKLVAFLVGMVVVGLLIVPKLMRAVVKMGRPETTVVTSIGLCFGLAHACAAMHYSVALGAFVAGVLISESGEGHTVEHLIVPIRDMFAAIFFVSVGMLIDPALALQNWAAVLVLTVVVIVGKVIGVGLGGIVTGCGVRTSVQAGLGLSQIGEFSFIIVGLGATLEVTRPFLFPVAVAVSAITTLTTPALVKRSEAAAKYVDDRVPRRIGAFISLYSAWVERVRKAPRSSTTGARLRRLAVLLVLDAAALVALLVGGGMLRGRIEQAAAAYFGLGPRAAQLLVFTAAALVALPFVFGVVRLTRGIGLAVAGVDRAAARPIALVVQLGLLVAVATVSITAVEPFVPAGLGFLLLVVLVGLAVVAFVRTARQFEVEVQAGGGLVLDLLKSKLGGEGAARAAHAEGHAALGSAGANEAPALLLGLGAPRLLRIVEGSSAVGRTLGELNLRATTGAAVLAIVRDGQASMMPGPTDRLEVGDVVAAVGSEEALSSAEALFSATEPEPEPYADAAESGTRPRATTKDDPQPA
ncbi:cation:proton antiporter [Polyangium spumosum]|uniref:Potassium transporter n=1 Tax=Polyangium spumosum TaxID=889282 RepID=A0A6N7Q0T4_9BACT|nr:cation:proton antiporter [Polyangium spumosum]MRG96155.1 potassium transporter [Polyangium spumosum]